MTLDEKIEMLQQILIESPTNYAESFKADILFQLEGYMPDQVDELFLSQLDNETQIRYWVDKLTSRIVMHEDDEVVHWIIQDYILCG